MLLASQNCNKMTGHWDHNVHMTSMGYKLHKMFWIQAVERVRSVYHHSLITSLFSDHLPHTLAIAPHDYTYLLITSENKQTAFTDLIQKSHITTTTLLRTETSGDTSNSRARAGTHCLAMCSFWRHSFPTYHIITNCSYNPCLTGNVIGDKITAFWSSITLLTETDSCGCWVCRA